MAKKKSVFTSEQGKTVSLSTKVSEELKGRIDHINDRLAVLSGDKKLRFNVSSIMADAIEDAVEEAEKELETLEKAGRKSTKGDGRPPQSVADYPSPKSIKEDQAAAVTS